jgi:hypothetical protein
MRNLWKEAFLFTAVLFIAQNSQASWHYNENGGFGIYEPEGWHAESRGRSSQLEGPDEEGHATEIFLGSDWVNHIDGLPALKRMVEKEEGVEPREVRAAGLAGFQVGSRSDGSTYLYRDRNNVIVIHFAIRGSSAQTEEAEEALRSIEVRTKGIEYP